MKTLYILISSNGDGSYSTNFTFDSELIDTMRAMYYKGKLDDRWIDGDGFQYTTLSLPDECTAESLGVTMLNPAWI